MAETEIEPLIEQPEKIKLQKPFTFVLNFANSALGTSVLANPYTLSLIGCAIAPLFYGFFIVFTCASYTMLKTSADKYSQYQLQLIGKLLFSKQFCIVIELLKIIFVLGTLVSFNVVCKDNFFFFRGFQSEKLFSILLLCGIFVVIVLPMCFLRSLDALKFNSFVDIAVMTFLIIVLIILQSSQPTRSDVQLINLNIESLFAIPLIIHSYAAILQFNYLNLYKELENRQSNVKLSTIVSLALCVTTFLLAGYFGYFTFGADTKSNVMKNLSQIDSLLARFANIAMIVLIIVHHPVVVYPLRKSIESLIYADKRPTRIAEIVIAISIIVVTTSIACFMKSVDNILDFTSTIGGGSISLIVPGLMYYHCAEKSVQKVIGIIFSCVGCGITLFGFGIAIFKWGFYVKA